LDLGPTTAVTRRASGRSWRPGTPIIPRMPWVGFPEALRRAGAAPGAAKAQTAGLVPTASGGRPAPREASEGRALPGDNVQGEFQNRHDADRAENCRREPAHRLLLVSFVTGAGSDLRCAPGAPARGLRLSVANALPAEEPGCGKAQVTTAKRPVSTRPTESARWRAWHFHRGAT
jgi:hypothetical protein